MSEEPSLIEKTLENLLWGIGVGFGADLILPETSDGTLFNTLFDSAAATIGVQLAKKYNSPTERVLGGLASYIGACIGQTLYQAGKTFLF